MAMTDFYRSRIRLERADFVRRIVAERDRYDRELLLDLVNDELSLARKWAREERRARKRFSHWADRAAGDAMAQIYNDHDAAVRLIEGWIKELEDVLGEHKRQERAYWKAVTDLRRAERIVEEEGSLFAPN